MNPHLDIYFKKFRGIAPGPPRIRKGTRQEKGRGDEAGEGKTGKAKREGSEKRRVTDNGKKR